MASADDQSVIGLGRERYGHFTALLGRTLSSRTLLNSEPSTEIARDEVDREE